MVDLTHERTLKGAILPPKAAHTNSLISVVTENIPLLLELSGLSSSIVFDTYIKIYGAKHIQPSRIEGFPCGIDSKYHSALFARVLMLNCVNTYYADLWNEAFEESFRRDAWSKDDVRLKPFCSLPALWDGTAVLRNEFERRQALVEIDVISAMALGLTLDELLLLYDIYFPISQKYEADTWYDRNGAVVFTARSSELSVDRKVWDRIRVEAEQAVGKGEGYSYTHTIEKSEMYKGRKVTFEAPFDRCDRVEDYRRAWEHFSKIFNNNN